MQQMYSFGSLQFLKHIIRVGQEEAEVSLALNLHTGQGIRRKSRRICGPTFWEDSLMQLTPGRNSTLVWIVSSHTVHIIWTQSVSGYSQLRPGGPQRTFFDSCSVGPSPPSLFPSSQSRLPLTASWLFLLNTRRVLKEQHQVLDSFQFKMAQVLQISVYSVGLWEVQVMVPWQDWVSLFPMWAQESSGPLEVFLRLMNL